MPATLPLPPVHTLLFAMPFRWLPPAAAHARHARVMRSGWSARHAVAWRYAIRRDARHTPEHAAADVTRLSR